MSAPLLNASTTFISVALCFADCVDLQMDCYCFEVGHFSQTTTERFKHTAAQQHYRTLNSNTYHSIVHYSRHVQNAVSKTPPPLMACLCNLDLDDDAYKTNLPTAGPVDLSTSFPVP
jgi:hypothetical protein